MVDDSLIVFSYNEMVVPARYKEADGWQPAQPADAVDR
jgi:hypothetical protein